MKRLLQSSLLLAALMLPVLGAFAQTSLTVTDGAANLDGVISPGEYTSQTMVTTGGVSLQAMGDGEFLYLAAQWTDASSTENVNKNMWTFDGATWTKSGNEDRIAFIWDMNQNGTDGANCTTMCHGGTAMGTNIGAVDVWHWKAARGGSTNGVADDKWWGPSAGDGRHSDAGTSAYSDNALDGAGNPTSMPQGGRATGTVFLAKDSDALALMTPISAHQVSLAVPFDPGAGWQNSDTIPGYVLRVPAGGRASVESRSTYDNGVWTVEFKKPYGGNVSDFAVIPGSSVTFTHEIFDNTGGGHPNDGFDATIYTLDFSTLAQSTTLTAAPGAATLDGQILDGEWTGAPLRTANNVSLFSMADNQNFYIAAQWADATENVNKNLWTFDGATWTKSGNEDRLAFIFDMGLNGANGANCTTMCHGSTMGTSNGVVDVWHWKAARGGVALGYADDKYWDVSTGDGRHSDAGTSTYSDNALDGAGNPTFMQTGGPATPAVFLATDQAALDIMSPMTTHASALSTAFDPGAGWANGDTVPGYVLRIPNGDRASVQSASSYENGVWTVEFKRQLAGGDHDFTAAPGGMVKFTHETFDNTGGGHPNDGFDATLYTLDFSLITGIEKQIAGEIPSAFELDQNYPNPFNPSTNIRFSLTENQQVTLAVYDPLGRLVKTLVNEDLAPGQYEVNFKATDLASGIYFYRLAARNNVQTRKMILVK